MKILKTIYDDNDNVDGYVVHPSAFALRVVKQYGHYVKQWVKWNRAWSYLPFGVCSECYALFEFAEDAVFVKIDGLWQCTYLDSDFDTDTKYMDDPVIHNSTCRDLQIRSIIV